MADVMPQHDYYEILQVHPKASLAVIKKAYRTLLLELGNHPDQGGDRDNAALITEAYGVLSDPDRRAEYDRTYFGEGVRASAEPPHAPRSAEPARAASTEGSSLIVLCPACRTKNRVRSQDSLAIAKCSKCGKPLSRAASTAWQERLLGLYQRSRAYVSEAANSRPTRKPTSPLITYGVPLLLIGASLTAAGYAISDVWGGLGDPVATADALAKEGKFDQAAVRLERAVTHDPGNPRLYELLGDVYAKQNAPLQALANYEKASHLSPQSSYYWDLQGGVYQNLGKLPEAELCYKHSLTIDPGYAPALVAMGNLKAKGQRFDDAVRLYQQALKQQASADVYYNLGMVQHWSGHPTEAAAAFKQALVLDPNNRSSMISLASLYYEQRQYDMAAAQLLKASQLKHTDLDLHLRLADCYEHTGHTKEAIKEWNLCLEQGKNNPMVQEQAHRALGRLHGSPTPSDG